jgi:hypothetical protein
MKERSIESAVAVEVIKESLIKDLEKVVRACGDKVLTIESFFEKICNSIKLNGIRHTSNNYELSESYLHIVEAYMKKCEGV